MGHSKLSPSKAGVWGSVNGCPGSVHVTPKAGPPTQDSLDGTAAHELAAIVLKGCVSKGSMVSAFDHTSTLAPNGVTYTDEMRESADAYSEMVFSLQWDHIYIESEVHPKAIHPTDNWGTSDMFAWSEELRTLYVLDYKYGHRLVEVFENLQCVNYAVGAKEALNLDGDFKIEMRIFQPRGFHSDGPSRVWRTTWLEIQPLVEQLQRKGALALSDKSYCQTGPHCHNCEGIHNCIAAQDASIQLYEAVSSITPRTLEGASLGAAYKLLLRAKEAIKEMEEAVKEQLHATLRLGGKVPGWELKEGKTSITWSVPPEEIYALGDLMGLTLSKKTPLTPLQAKKLGLSEEVLPAYTMTTGGGLVLAQTDSLNQKAKKVFNV